MDGRRIRLGDVIDDYCTRCGLIMNHGVVGMVGDDVRKVRCNTCITEHVYKHARLPKRKRDQTAKLFDEVLKGLGRKTDSEAAAEAAAGATEDAAAEERSDPEDETEAGATVAAPVAAAVPPAEPAPAAEPEREGVEAHRRKLYTIRRHTGGKPPGTGTPHR
jgi:hypothetical protein